MIIEGARAAIARDPQASAEEALRLAQISANPAIPFTRKSLFS